MRNNKKRREFFTFGCIYRRRTTQATSPHCSNKYALIDSNSVNHIPNFFCFSFYLSFLSFSFSCLPRIHSVASPSNNVLRSNSQFSMAWRGGRYEELTYYIRFCNIHKYEKCSLNWSRRRRFVRANVIRLSRTVSPNNIILVENMKWTVCCEWLWVYRNTHTTTTTTPTHDTLTSAMYMGECWSSSSSSRHVPYLNGNRNVRKIK